MALRECSAPRGVFPGKNFMTPHIEGYYKLREGYAELSSGEGMTREPIFGVTVRGLARANDDVGRALERERSKMFHSRKAAIDYIKEMS